VPVDRFARPTTLNNDLRPSSGRQNKSGAFAIYKDLSSSNNGIHRVLESITLSSPLPWMIYQRTRLIRLGSAVVSATCIGGISFWSRWHRMNGENMLGLPMKI
jgi:hypothetical protein